MYLQCHWVGCLTPIFPLTVAGSGFGGASGECELYAGNPLPGFGSRGPLTCGQNRLPQPGLPQSAQIKMSLSWECAANPSIVLHCAILLSTICSGRSAGTCSQGRCLEGWRQTPSWISELEHRCLAWPGKDTEAPFVGRAFPLHLGINSLTAGRCHESQV